MLTEPSRELSCIQSDYVFTGKTFTSQCTALILGYQVLKLELNP